MKLKNVLIIVKDIERSCKYYHDLFGLELVRDKTVIRHLVRRKEEL